MWFPLLFATLAIATPSPIPNCRCLHGQSCWPDQSAFTSLASQISQPLLKPLPPASPCYPASSPSGNCTDVTNNFADGFWRSDQPGAEQNINFETVRFANGTISACYLDTTLGFPCEQGAIPPVGVDARNVGDIQAAIAFAQNCHTWRWSAIEVYEAVQQHGRVFVGGACPSVGPAGGWVMGGGHSLLSPRHGLGVDNVIQFNIVTVDGTYLTANTYQNSDLFWALRGGGGGTYGVVTSATYLTHPTVPLIISTLTANFSTVAIAKTVLTEFLRLHPQFAQVGWGGYATISSTQLDILYLSPNTSWSDTNATMIPFFNFVHNATGGDTISATQPIDSFYALYKTAFSTAGGVAFNVELSSRLMSKELVERDPESVAQIMVDVATDQFQLSSVVVGGAVAQPDPESMGLNPAWRKALVHMYIAITWDDGSSTKVINKQIQEMIDRTKILDKLSVDSGSYINEGSMHEENFQKTYFGEHYGKLEAIKRKYDPRGLFIVISGVGSEDWDHDLQCQV